MLVLYFIKGVVMRYRFTETPVETASEVLLRILEREILSGKKILWLLSGGSSLDIAVRVSQNLKGMYLGDLTVSMTDERYGLPGHKDENWQQLLDAGLSLPGANLYRPLNGKSRINTTIDFNKWLESALDEAEYKIGIFGMGEDGHTAGISPGTKAVSSRELAAEFTGHDFERITITPTTVAQMDEAIIQISGQNKAQQLHKLLGSELSLDEQPAQILKSIPQATIYTDIKLTI